MVSVTGKNVGPTSLRSSSYPVEESSTGVLLPRTPAVFSRFATSAQRNTQVPLRSMNSGGVAHAAVRSILRAVATKMTTIGNRLTADRDADISDALDHWKVRQVLVKTHQSRDVSKTAVHTQPVCIADPTATQAGDGEVAPEQDRADIVARNAAARALASGAKWLKRADRPAYRRIFSKTPFHGFSRLPAELRGTHREMATHSNGISESSAAESVVGDNNANALTSADVDLPVNKLQHDNARNPADSKPSRQLQKVFFLIDKMQRVDRISLQRGHHSGVHSGGLTDVLSGAASAFLARIGIHAGIAMQRSRQFSLYLNESWLEMQFNTIEGTEAELGVAVGLGVADAGALEDVHIRAGATVRADALSVQKERIKGIVIRIPCKWENNPGVEYDARVHKAKETAKKILLLLQQSGRECDKPDGHRILHKLANDPEFSEVSIQPVNRSTRQRSSSKLSLDVGFAIRASRALFTGVMARLGLERVWKERHLHEDPSLKIIKEGKSVLASVGGAAGLSVGDANTVFAPFEAFGGVQGALARDEEGLHYRVVDGSISPWSFREVAFSDAQSLSAYVKRWCEVHGRQACQNANNKLSYDEWERDLFKQLDFWQDVQSRGREDHKEYDYTYAARFRLTPDAVGHLNVLNGREVQVLATVDCLYNAYQKSRQDKSSPRLLSLPADQRISEYKRFQAIELKNSLALIDALSRLRQLRAERAELLRSIDSFGPPVLYSYKNAGHKEILGLRMLAGIFARTTVIRRDTSTVMKGQTLQAYINKRAALTDVSAKV